MSKRIWSFVVLVIFLCSFSILAFAHNRSDHDKELAKVLLGPSGTSGLSPQATSVLKALECAAYLSIDQFNGNGSDDLYFLRAQGVKGLPGSISELDFSGNHDHRRYTHMGWDNDYVIDRAQWKTVRRPILLNTVNTFFNFGLQGQIVKADKLNLLPTDEASYDKACVSFCALIYYAHILGDHEADNFSTFRKSKTKVSLAEPHPGETNRDIIYDLQKHIGILFKDQRDSEAYTAIMAELNKIGTAVRKETGSVGGINTEEKFTIIHPYAKMTLDALSRYVPELLQNTTFFSAVFSPQ